jgi:ectoine hydroxylase-related dioxygenase (phytanoyl-CoA dioxygenase family)
MTVGNSATVDWRILDDVRPLVAATKRQSVELAAGAIDDFERDGVALVRDAFVDWVEPLRSGLQRTLDAPERYAFPCDSVRDHEPGRFFDTYCNWQLVPEYLAFVLTSSAASMAAQMMRSTTAQLFHDHAFCKEPGTRKATPWHQDLPYYCIDGRQTASVYVALDHIPADIAVQFLKGSHRAGRLYAPRDFATGGRYDSGNAADEALEPVPEIDTISGPDDRFCAELVPGDALVFDFRTLHGSTATKVGGRRRAFSTRWLGDDVVYLDRPGETSPPLHDLGLRPGDRMRDDWFPVLWP